MKNVSLKVPAVVLALALAGSSMAGCGKTQEKKQTAAENTPPPVKMETIKVWTNSGSTKDLVTKMVEEYNKGEGKKKGINMEYTVNGSDHQKIYELAFASGQAPEILYVPGSPAEPAKKGWLIPLEDMPGGQAFLKKYDGLINNSPAFTYDGKTYSVPFNITNIKLIYNKEIFKKAGIVDAKGEAKPPKTWAEVREYAKKMTNPAEKIYGIAIPMKWGGYFDWELVMPFISSVGHNVFDNKTGRYNFSDFKPAFEWLQGIMDDKSLFPGAEGLDNDPARAQFAEGRIAMKFGANWDVGVLNDQFPAKFDWGAADIPVLDPSNRYKEFATAAPWASITSTAKSANKEKIMEVYKWFNSDEFLATMYEEGKFVPYKQSIVNMAKKQPDEKGWSDFSKIDKIHIFLSKPPVKIEGETYAQVMAKIWAKGISIDQGLADLDKRYNEALDKAVKSGELDIKPFIDSNYDVKVK